MESRLGDSVLEIWGGSALGFGARRYFSLAQASDAKSSLDACSLNFGRLTDSSELTRVPTMHTHAQINRAREHVLSAPACQGVRLLCESRSAGRTVPDVDAKAIILFGRFKLFRAQQDTS